MNDLIYVKIENVDLHKYMEMHKKKCERAQNQMLQKLPLKEGSGMGMGLKKASKQWEEAEKKEGAKFFWLFAFFQKKIHTCVIV